MRLLITGAAGFLGWHLRSRLFAQAADVEVVAVDKAEWVDLAHHCAGVDAVIHLAGVNRATPEEVSQGNVDLAQQLVDALDAAGASPSRIVYSNSIHAGGDTPYGNGKAGAAKVLQAWADAHGSHVVNVLLPNLFGEHGRPNYNSFVATFAHAVAADQPPAEVTDNQVPLLHVQKAAQALIDSLTCHESELRPQGRMSGVVEVLDKLTTWRAAYKSGELVNTDDEFDEALFNTLRAAMFPEQYPIALVPHADDRGRFVEMVRVQGGEGQTSISTTKPGITRGNHFHLHKCERFAVVSGRARISLRKVLTDEVVHFDVDGETPVVVDMPTLWSHNITNTGDDELVTLFWINRMYDPADPDTYPDPV